MSFVTASTRAVPPLAITPLMPSGEYDAVTKYFGMLPLLSRCSDHRRPARQPRSTSRPPWRMCTGRALLTHPVGGGRPLGTSQGLTEGLLSAAWDLHERRTTLMSAVEGVRGSVTGVTQSASALLRRVRHK